MVLSQGISFLVLNYWIIVVKVPGGDDIGVTQSVTSQLPAGIQHTDKDTVTGIAHIMQNWNTHLRQLRPGITVDSCLLTGGLPLSLIQYRQWTVISLNLTNCTNLIAGGQSVDQLCIVSD